MKFTLNTKPFSDALNLGVIPSNISKFYHKSCLAQLTASKSELKVSLEASNVFTELLLKGSGDAEETVTVFVDCLTLKQLVATFEAAVTTIEFSENGIVLHSGQSKFSLPKSTDATASLRAPALAEPDAVTIKLNKDAWKFVQDNQMYAIAMSFTYPVYTRVWIGDSGDVIVGDYNSSLFTFSKKSDLGRTCLLTDTAINLLNMVPDGATITTLDKSYRIDLKTDAFEYAAEFTPEYEDEESTGSYNSDIILGLKSDDAANRFKIQSAPITKLLSQADLLSSSNDDKMTISYSGSTLDFTDTNVNCKVPVEIDSTVVHKNFSAEFKTAKLRSIISHLDGESFTMMPVFGDDDATKDIVMSIHFITPEITAILASTEE